VGRMPLITIAFLPLIRMAKIVKVDSHWSFAFQKNERHSYKSTGAVPAML